MNESDVNSRGYWDQRFREDWDSREGREQSRFFARIGLELAPDWLLRAVRSGQWSVVDWGCAEGDGTQILAEALEKVEGVDFSAEAIERARAAYPAIGFHAEDWVGTTVSSERSYDIVFSSNTLEHFHAPWSVLEVLTRHAKRFVVLLLPFREFERHFEHFVTFDFDTVRAEAYGMHLVHAAVKDVSRMPHTQWPGEQVLLVYGRPQEAAALQLNYKDLRIDSADAVGAFEDLRNVTEERDRLVTEGAHSRGKIELLTGQLSEAMAGLARIEVDRAAWVERANALEAEITAVRERLVCSEREAGEAKLTAEALTNTVRELTEENQRAKDALRGMESGWRRTRIGRLVNSLRTRGVIATGLLVGSRAYNRWAMNWYAFLFDAYVRSRRKLFPVDWSKVVPPAESGLVSVVLPCFNGEDMVAESIESVLAQTYPHFELILLDDGSTDSTGRIFDDYARRDPRVRVFHQENRKLPRTLSRGFREARGEFLTWTSADNRMKSECLEHMVAALRRDQALDMVYANLDIIGPKGQPLKGSPWYSHYQSPPGSEHIHLPQDASELNVWPNNFIGACFMYRARVAHVLREYSPTRFCTEDYDYWMRVNSLFRLRHIGVSLPLYDYRFHPNSLTSKDKELKITENRVRLMVFEDFRRSFLLSPGIWVLETSDADVEREYADRLAAKLRASGHKVYTPERFAELEPARQWSPMIWMRVAADLTKVGAPTQVDGMVSILGAVGQGCLQAVSERWTWCVALDPDPAMELPRLANAYQGWTAVSGIDNVIASVDALAKEHQLASIEEEAEAQWHGRQLPELDASVIICTYRRSASFAVALRSALAQTFNRRRYEVIVVNNEPDEPYPRTITDEIRAELLANEDAGHLRVVDCPIPGLSHARNAGLAASRGGVLLFLDDDAVAQPDCLARIVDAYRSSPELGVVGGHIVLDPPKPAPEVLRPGREALWSHFVTFHEDLTVVRHWWEYPWGANWSARRDVLYSMGGFRSNFGRNGGDFGGGEEIVAAAQAVQLGYDVAVEPRAVVLHQVEARRFTEQHIRKTVLAGVLVNYQMQTSMYLPFEASLTRTTKEMAHDMLAAMKTAFGSSHGQDSLLASAHRRARRRLWLRQFQDRLMRLRKPISKQ